MLLPVCYTSAMILFLILMALPLMDLAIVPDGSCPAGGSTCDTLVDNSKVLQDILEVQGCCTHPDCPAGMVNTLLKILMLLVNRNPTPVVPNNGECQQEMASALQPCLQQGDVGISKEVCVMEVGTSCIITSCNVTIFAETLGIGQCHGATKVQ